MSVTSSIEVAERFSASRNSGSWPTWKTSGFDSPAGVSSRNSRGPGLASVAIVTRTVTVSAMAGVGGFSGLL